MEYLQGNRAHRHHCSKTIEVVPTPNLQVKITPNMGMLFDARHVGSILGLDKSFVALYNQDDFGMKKKLVAFKIVGNFSINHMGYIICFNP